MTPEKFKQKVLTAIETWNEEGMPSGCMYLDKDGKSCIIGHYLGKEGAQAVQLMYRGATIRDILSAAREAYFPEETGEQIDLLADLQKSHDFNIQNGASQEGILASLRDIAGGRL